MATHAHNPILTHEHGHRHVEQDMLSVEEAYERIMSSFRPLEPVATPILDTLGHVLAEDISSPLDLPPMANSGMDGYAVRRDDIINAAPGHARQLKVIGLVAAGQLPSQTVLSGTAVRIMTGAPVPDGADTVVPFEETDEVQRRKAGLPLEEVAILADLPLGSNVRPAGEDVGRGQLVLEAGTLVRAAEIGVMASLGMKKAKVTRSPVVSILATGDELVPMGAALEGGKIYDSNSFTVAASVIACGGIPKPLGIAKDDLGDLHQKLEAAADSDLVVTSAGVSKGDYDIVKDVLTQRGDINFWSVRMRASQTPGLWPSSKRERKIGAAAGTARKPGERHGGLRDVRPARHPGYAGPQTAGPSYGGRRAHQSDSQCRWAPGLRQGRGEVAKRDLLRHSHRAPGLKHPDFHVPGQRTGDMPREPIFQESRRKGPDHYVGLERRG